MHSVSFLKPGVTTTGPITSFRTPTPYPNMGDYTNHGKAAVLDGQGYHHLSSTPTIPWSVVIS
jgi:hypothetical protein